MKYLCLVYGVEEDIQAMPVEDCLEYDAALRDNGRCVASEALQPVYTATTVRVRNGRVSLTDGPFAETKEQLAGFYLNRGPRSQRGRPNSGEDPAGAGRLHRGATDPTDSRYGRFLVVHKQDQSYYLTLERKYHAGPTLSVL